MKQDEYQEKIAAIERSVADPAEQVLGTCVASWPSTFKSKIMAIIATDQRLVLQELDRKINQRGETISLPPDRIQSAELSGIRGRAVSSVVMDAATVTIKIRTTDGRKIKLVTMTGEGLQSGFDGASDHRQAIEAILERLGLIETGQI